MYNLYYFIYLTLFIYLLLAVLGVCCCTGFSFVVVCGPFLVVASLASIPRF